MSTDVRLGWVIVHVRDVGASVDFWDRAFGIPRRFVSEDGGFAELETGATALAFVEEGFGSSGLSEALAPVRPDRPAAAIEVCLVTADVPGLVERATAAGARLVEPPARKPWGQTVAYVRDLDGVLVEIASPVAPPA